MALINLNVVSDLKDRTEFMIIGFDYKKEEQKEIIEHFKQECKTHGLWWAFGGEIEE